MAGKGNGGAETYAADMILALHEQGIEQIAVLHPRQPRSVEVQRSGVPVDATVLQWPLLPLQRARLRRLIASWRPDLVHCWMRRAASLVPVLEVPAIGWFGGYYDVANFPHCSHFIGVTPDIVRHQREQGAQVERSFFVPTFPVTEAPEQPLDRAALGVPPGATVLLTLSRLHPKKGLDTLVQAMKDLPDCVLWLAGDGPMRETLQSHAAQRGVAARVKFLGWRTDRGALLRAADICVLPSRYEPFGTVMLEAWACGTPLVAAAAAGPAAFVQNGENGLLVPVNDPKALAQAIRSLRDDAVLRARLAQGGLTSYQAQFTRLAVTTRMLEVYRQVLALGR